MTTFNFENVSPGTLKLAEKGAMWRRGDETSQTLFSQKIAQKQKITPQFSTDRDNTIAASYSHGLMGALFTAYSKHVPLTLSPDDVWIAVCTAFGNYTVTHAEEMRDCFVDHNGTETIEIKGGSIDDYATEEAWVSFLGEMEKKIAERVHSGVTEWLRPDFTTTTVNDRAVSNIVLMGTMKKYLKYKLTLCCGLSKVTLEGSLDDWKQLVEKARHLYSFKKRDLDNWADLLIPVLEKFVDAYQNRIDEKFWQSVITSKGYGSGDQRTHMGWFLVFSPFDRKGHPVLNTKSTVEKTGEYGKVDDDDIVDCCISAPLLIDDQNTGKKYNATFYGGMLVCQYENDTLRPCVDWALVINEQE